MKTRIQHFFAGLFELILMLLGAAATAAATALGKLFLAVVLGIISFGIFLRFTTRRQKAKDPLHSYRLTWLTPVTMIITLIESVLLVEAVDLPVRMSQAGFQYWHWGLVLGFLWLAFQAQFKFFSLFFKPSTL